MTSINWDEIRTRDKGLFCSLLIQQSENNSLWILGDIKENKEFINIELMESIRK